MVHTMSKIEWTDLTWNPIAGCSLVSPGCKNCYAMSLANRLLDKPGSHYEGTTDRVNGKAVWTGKIKKAPEHILRQPLHWHKPSMVFVNSMSDLFHEDVPCEWIDEIFGIMAFCPDHIFQVLTKRPERMREYMMYGQRLTFAGSKISAPIWPLPNVWMGVSVEDQRRANKRIPHLLNTKAAVRFLSMEPLLEPVDLNAITTTAKKDHGRVPLVIETCLYNVADKPAILPLHDTNKIDWVIVGGESGTNARPMHPDWVRFTRDQCAAAGVPFFFKQWGKWTPLDDYKGRKDWMIVDHRGGIDIPDDRWPDESSGEVAMVAMGKGAAGRTLDGRTWYEIPEKCVKQMGRYSVNVASFVH